MLGLEDVKAGTVGFGNVEIHFSKYIVGIKWEGKRVEKSRSHIYTLKRHGLAR